MDNTIYSKMFNWLFIGLLITFISGYCLSLNQVMLYKTLTIGIIPIIVIELGIAIAMGFFIKKMSTIATKICYIIYCITTGITFGVIFLTYQMNSIIFIFLVTALIFGVLALIGYKTKKDVFKIGNVLFITLIAVIIMSLLNALLFKSTTIELLIGAISIFLFMGYIVYDMNTVKYLMNTMDEDKAAVYGAFQLYLDFINLFIRLIEFFGKKRD